MTKNSRLVLAIIFLFFSFCNIGYALDEKEEARRYLDSLRRLLTEVQLTHRSVSQRLLPLEQGTEKMQALIDTLESLTPPDVMERQHKMLLSSFSRLKAGFSLLSKGHDFMSLRLVRRGAELLKTATDQIVELAREKDLIAESRKGEGQ